MARRPLRHPARHAATDAIVAGIERAARLGLTKPHDVATSIKVELDDAGIKLVYAPRKED